MDEFLIYLRLGFDHITDPRGYDHILFVVALVRHLYHPAMASGADFSHGLHCLGTPLRWPWLRCNSFTTALP